MTRDFVTISFIQEVLGMRLVLGNLKIVLITVRHCLGSYPRNECTNVF